MLILDTVNRKLEVVLAAIVATSELPWTSAFVDVTTATYVPGSSNGVSNGTTPVSLVVAPAAATQRQVKLLTVYNLDTAPVRVKLQLDDSATKRVIASVLLPIGASLFYVDGVGLQVVDANGNLLTTTAVSGHEANHISGGADPFLSTDLLEAIVKRLKETGGATLAAGAIADGQYFKRSGTTFIGVAGVESPATQVVNSLIFK